MSDNGAGENLPAAPAPDRLPWEKRAKETGKAFHNFAHYRDLGVERSLAKAAADLGLNIGTVQEQSVKYDWVERAELYDLHLERLRREEFETELTAAQARHRMAAQVAQRIGLQRLRGDEDNNVQRLDPNSLDADDTVRMLEFGIRNERLALGQPTEMLRTGMAVSPTDFKRYVEGIVAIALEELPEERHERFWTRFNAFVAGGGR